jgi:hypothetical protein
MPLLRNLLLAASLLWVAPLAQSTLPADSSYCAPKKQNKSRNRNSKSHKRSTSKQSNKPRVVGKRDPLKLPSLSSKVPKNIKTKPYKPPTPVAGSLQVYTPKSTQSLRIVGTVQKSVETRTHPITLRKTEIRSYFIATSIGDVPLTEAALRQGGQAIDLEPYIGHRIRVTGDGYYQNEQARKGLRFDAITHIETE